MNVLMILPPYLIIRNRWYLSRTVEVQEHQKGIDTGLYGIVRHPMYAATVILFLSMGLILGSPISFFILLFYLPIIAKRIKKRGSGFDAGSGGVSGVPGKGQIQGDPVHLVKQVRIQRRS